MVLKHWAKQLLRVRGLELKHRADETGKCIDLLDLAFSARVRSGTRGHVLQIGANDGFRDDPLRQIILKYEFPALLVEPLPDLFTELVANYASYEFVRCENCAISNSSGERDLYRVVGGDGVPDWALGMAGFDPQTILKHRNQVPTIEQHIQKTRVQTRTVEAVLARHGVTDVFCLQVDTEGYDFEVIKMCLASGMRPDIINYEYVHLSLDDQQACRIKLAGLGYRFLNTGKDTLALMEHPTRAVESVGGFGA